MDVVDVLRSLGGSARWPELKGSLGRREFDRAVTAGALERRRGVYSLPEDDRARVAARQLRGVVTHRSAAALWGFALPPRLDGEPELHEVAIRPNARRAHVPEDVRLRYPQLLPDDIVDKVLTPTATVAFCLRDLPLREALSIGDSALRSGSVTIDKLRRRVQALRGRGAGVARRRVELLDGRAANAFESSCRAILIEGNIAGFEPQIDISHKRQWIGRVDLAHRGWRIVIECDGFETHGKLEAMTKDCSRHTLLVAAGWRPLRFTWYQVMFAPDWVLERVRDAIEWAERVATAS